VFDGELKERIKQLCDLIAKEQDHQRFSLLIAELNQLLEEVQPLRDRSDSSAQVPLSSQPPEPSQDPEC
jgi:hypothetical protein